MIDPFDYKEPNCPLCNGKDFYYPKKHSPKGSIPVNRIIEKLEHAFNKNDMLEAQRLLEYWQLEAQELLDKKGELSVVNEMLGLYRKLNHKQKAYQSIQRAVKLIEELKIEKEFSCGSIYLNIATTFKAIEKTVEGLPFYDKAFEIFSASPNRSKDLMSGFYNNKAVALASLGKNEDALLCYEKALEHLKNTPNEFTDSAITLINLCHLYYQMDDIEKAKECVKKAILLLEDERVIKNGYYAYVLEKCLPAIVHFGYDNKADEYEKIIKEIYEGN